MAIGLREAGTLVLGDESMKCTTEQNSIQFSVMDLLHVFCGQARLLAARVEVGIPVMAADVGRLALVAALLDDTLRIVHAA